MRRILLVMGPSNVRKLAARISSALRNGGADLVSYFQGSPESRDGDDEIREKLTRVEQQLQELLALQRSNIPPKL